MSERWANLPRTKYPGVRRQASGQFVVQARVADGENRIRLKQETLPAGATIDGAVVARAELMQGLRREIHVEEGRVAPTLGDYAKLWLRRKKREKLRAHTLEGYLVNLERHILPFLGNHQLDEIGSRDIVRWKDEACGRLMENGKHYSAWTMSSWFSVLRNIFSDAVIEFELPRNPCDGIRAPKKSKAPRRERTLSAEQLREFLALVKVHCNQHYAIALTLAVYGLRWEEASALHQKHVDEEAGELHIVQSQVRRRVYPTKNDSAKLLPLIGEVQQAIVEHLQLMKMRANPGLRKGLLFPDSNGDYRLPSSVSKGWKVVSKEMKLSWAVTPHDLRRTYQNLLRQASVNTVVQQALMGHSSDGMTEHYSHVNMEEKRRAQDQVIDLLRFRKAKDGA
jgi:integrase